MLSFLQEVVACHVAGVPFVVSKRAPQYAHALAALKVDAKAVKMFIYGFFVSAPLNHYMMGALQRTFAGKTSRGAKLGQLFAANFVVAPISTFGAFYVCAGQDHGLMLSLIRVLRSVVFLYSMAVINGANTVDAAVARARAGFMRMLAVRVIVSPHSHLAD